MSSIRRFTSVLIGSVALFVSAVLVFYETSFDWKFYANMSSLQTYLSPKVTFDKINVDNLDAYIILQPEGVRSHESLSRFADCSRDEVVDVQPIDSRIFLDILEKYGCEKILKGRGYRTKPMSTEEAEYPIAMNFKIYRHFEQFERMFRLVYHPQNVYCIHIDKKADNEFSKAVKALIKCPPLNKNVILSERRAKVYWSHYSTLLADLFCFESLIKLFPGQWEYLINLTGEELPLHSNLELVRMAKALNGRNWIGFFKMARGSQIRRTEWRYRFQNGRNSRLRGQHNEPPPINVTICKGDIAGVFSYRFIGYMINDRLASAYVREWCRHTRFADEHCFQSLHCSHQIRAPGGYKGKEITTKWQNFPRIKWWSWASNRECHGRETRGICIFDSKDTSEILNWSLDRQKYNFKPFGNKFFLHRARQSFRCLEMFHDALSKSPHLAWTKQEIAKNILADERVENCRTNNDNDL